MFRSVCVDVGSVCGCVCVCRGGVCVVKGGGSLCVLAEGSWWHLEMCMTMFCELLLLYFCIIIIIIV